LRRFGGGATIPPDTSSTERKSGQWQSRVLTNPFTHS
jgi:hypothetical protein